MREWVNASELPSNLVLGKLRVGEVAVEGGVMAVDVWRVRDVDGGEVWIPAMYGSEKNDGDQVKPMDEEQRVKLVGWLGSGWPMALAVQLAFGEWDETVFGSKEEIAKKYPREVAMVAVAGPDNRGKSTAVARLGAIYGNCDVLDADPFSSENQRAAAYLSEIVGHGLAYANADRVLSMIQTVRGEELNYLGPKSLNGILCGLVNANLHPERREVLVLDMPGLQERRLEMEAQDLFYLFSVPYVWYEGGEGESLAEKAESGLVWLMGQLPGKVEEFKKREEMFKQAVGGYGKKGRDIFS